MRQEVGHSDYPMRRIRETSVRRSGVTEGVPERRVHASATRCRAIGTPSRPSLRPFGIPVIGVHPSTGLRPETPIAVPSRRFLAADVPRQPTGQPAWSGFTASHNSFIETRVYQRPAKYLTFSPTHGAISEHLLISVVISVLIVDHPVRRRRVRYTAVAFRT